MPNTVLYVKLKHCCDVMPLLRQSKIYLLLSDNNHHQSNNILSDCNDNKIGERERERERGDEKAKRIAHTFTCVSGYSFFFGHQFLESNIDCPRKERNKSVIALLVGCTIILSKSFI